MPRNISLKSPAKLNLTLKVLPKRADGFHNIESIFQKINLCDQLAISVTENGCCELSVDGMVLPEENTVTKAFALFEERVKTGKGVKVQLNKIIPSGAGMGGGSSDAATMLQGLNALFDARLSDEELFLMAEKIGSDVPFFLGNSCALVSGRGEIIKPITSRSDICFVVVCPEVHCSTKEAYALVDQWQQNHEDDACWLKFSELEKEYRQSVKNWRFFNSFTKPIFAEYAQIEQALKDVRSCGADFAEMTGSGSTVFGVFESEEKAQQAYNNLSARWKRCYLCSAF